MAESAVYVVIVAGGTGTRLWPLSKKSQPKQFLDIFNQGSFISGVYERAKSITQTENIYIVAPEPYATFLDKYLPNFPKQNFMAEPAKKGTTAAYGYAAIYIKQINPNATLHILAADDYVEDLTRYQRMLNAATQIASESGSLVIYGTPPRDPNTGYGYVQVDLNQKKTIGDIDSYPLASYHEKPPLADAQKYLQSPDYFWHCSGFSVSVSKLLELIKKHDPATFTVLENIELDMHLPARVEAFNLKTHYDQLLESDIEKKILENLDEPVYMVTMESTWSDIGTWDHVFEIKSKKEKPDESGNYTMGEKQNIFSEQSKNNLIFASQKPLALVGVENLVVIETDEVTLVCSRDHSQSVKQMVNLLKEKRPELV